jgi:hypothetical protein
MPGIRNAFASFHHKWFTADRIAGRLHIPRFGALRSAAERAAVGFASPMKAGSSRRDDQKPGNVIANDHFASPTDLEMTSAFGPERRKAMSARTSAVRA